MLRTAPLSPGPLTPPRKQRGGACGVGNGGSSEVGVEGVPGVENGRWTG